MNRRILAMLVMSGIVLGTSCSLQKETKRRKTIEEDVSETSDTPETSPITTAPESSETEDDGTIHPVKGDGTLWNTFRGEIDLLHDEIPELEFTIRAEDPYDAGSYNSLLVKNGNEVSEYVLSDKDTFIVKDTYSYEDVSESIVFHSYDEIMSLPVFPTNDLLTKEIKNKEDVSNGIYMGKVVGIKKDGTQALVEISCEKEHPDRLATGLIIAEYEEFKYVVMDDYVDMQGLRWLSLGWVINPDTYPDGLVKTMNYPNTSQWAFEDSVGRSSPTNCYVVLDISPTVFITGDFDADRADDDALDGYDSFRDDTTRLTDTFFWYSITHDVTQHVEDLRYSGSINSDDWFAVDVNGDDELLIVQYGFLAFLY